MRSSSKPNCQGHIDIVDQLKFSSDGKLLAVAWQTGTRLIAVEDGSTISTLPDNWAVAFSPTGELLATGDGNAVVIWDVTKF